MWVIPHRETGVACSRNSPPSLRGRPSVVLLESCISELARVSTSSINLSLFLPRPSAAPSSLSPSFCQLSYKDGTLGLRLGWRLQLVLLLVARMRPALRNSIFPPPLVGGALSVPSCRNLLFLYARSLVSLTLAVLMLDELTRLSQLVSGSPIDSVMGQCRRTLCWRTPLP